MNNTRPMTATEIKALNILNEHRGKQKAIPLAEFTKALGLTQERDARRIREHLIKCYRVAIGISYDEHGGGYYLIRTRREGEESAYKLIKHAISMLYTASVLKQETLRELVGQLKLPLEG